MVKIEMDKETASRLLGIINDAYAEIHNRKSALRGLTVAQTYDRLRTCETIREQILENLGQTGVHGG